MVDLNYEPNWANGHVQKRVAKVLDWAAPYMIGKFGSQVPLNLSAKGFMLHGKRVPGLNDIFGPKGNALGDYLRSLLLIPVSKSYVPGEKSRTYNLSREGFRTIEGKRRTADTGAYGGAHHVPERGGLEAFDLSTPVVSEDAALDRMVQKHAAELQSLTFQYNDQSNRLWHGLQNLPRDKKSTFWRKHGLPFNYDIVACAPTILFQLARSAGLPAILTETLRTYLDDRSRFRSHVSALTGLSADDSKRLINSLFNGAKLGNNPRWSAFQLLGCDTRKMDTLKNDPLVSKLCRDIKSVWKRIEGAQAAKLKPTFQDRLEGKTDQGAWKLKSSRAKWSVYFRAERLILNAVTSYLNERDIRVFTEHDGFRTSARIEAADLTIYVKSRTGFEMSFEEKE